MSKTCEFMYMLLKMGDFGCVVKERERERENIPVYLFYVLCFRPLHVLGWVVPAIISFLPFAGNHYGPAGAWWYVQATAVNTLEKYISVLWLIEFC